MSSTAGWRTYLSVAPPSSNINLMHRQFQDLNQDDPFVRSTLLQWAASLKGIGFDGLRIDTVPEVKPSFWSEFTQAAGMYTVGNAVILFHRRTSLLFACVASRESAS
jgi:glycosidase